MRKYLAGLALLCAAFGGSEAQAFGWDWDYPSPRYYYSPYSYNLHPSFYQWDYGRQWGPRVRYVKPRYRTIRVLEAPPYPFLAALATGGSPYAREFFDQLDRDHFGSSD